MRRTVLVSAVAPTLVTIAAYAQTPAQPTAPAATQAQPDPPADPLGRESPQGTVLGFLDAARKDEIELARQYLNTALSGEAGQTLARQLYVVLDARLPAGLSQISEAPDGSGSNPLAPDEDVIGTIVSSRGPVEVVVERLRRRNAPPIWLFSRRTLESVPALFEEVTASQSYRGVFGSLARTRPGGVLLIEWLIGLLGLIVFYFATVLLNRILTPLVSRVWKATFKRAQPLKGNVLPVPARLLIVALAGKWVLSSLSLSLLVREFWSNVAGMLTIAAIVWLLILLNGEIEQYIRRFLPFANRAAASQLLRLLRRTADALVLFAGLIATLRLLSVDPTPALAGLGVGGIAVALAAQKTLENIVAGASLIFDQAVRVGDHLKMGTIEGIVDHIGLRSTRIRTNDRTVVSVPNAQIASTSLETISARDKYWFHPVVGLRYETTAAQLRTVVDGFRQALESHPLVEARSLRVRFVQLGAFSLDVEINAYIDARDLNHFLEVQEELLFSITEIVSDAGTAIAFPTQTMHVANTRPSERGSGTVHSG
jgi:MscS family membrane protein